MKESGRNATLTRSRGRSALHRSSIGFHTGTGADWVSITIDIVDAAHRRPEFVLAQPSCGIRGLFARIRMLPFVRGQNLGRVRGILEKVIARPGFAGFDGLNFSMDGDHGVAKPVEFGFAFAL